MASNRRWLAALSLALSLGGCSNGLSQLSSLPSSPVSTYRVGVGDELRVMIPELTETNSASVTYIVNESGNLSLPVLGDVPASGKTVPDLQRDLVQRLVGARLLSAPTVSIQPVRLRPIYVLGEVQRPGEYAFSPGMSVLAAVAAAGGYTFRARETQVGITRIVDGKQITGRATENDMLQPGDAVRVYERWL
ncbi:polysaccharide biosynthesis/export family protein [Novosphingobium sp. RD2P27]|uniref:Polysaccharide biosynthesis/export family protein n=1 Tax=Novosphingobium kalidii TaxID=3230299 RepID=A0ABV2D498_9SPHN